MSVTPQLAFVLMGSSTIVATRRNDWLDSAFDEKFANAVTVICAIGDQAFGLLGKPVFVELIERRFEEPDFGWGRRIHVNSERSTRAICRKV